MARGGVGRTALVLALAGCRNLAKPVDVGVPPDAVVVRAPIQYASWWRTTEACSGLRGDFTAVRWYTAARGGSFAVDGVSYQGYWFSDGNRIVIAAGSERDGPLVRHEMLHALLRRGDHPAAYFVERCGAVAPCGPTCNLREADRGVPADAREVPSESLAVVLATAPGGTPALSVDSGWVTLTVTATNARPEPVWVRLPVPAVSFGVVFAAGWRHAPSPETRWAFRAQESRSLTLDLQFRTVASDTGFGYFGRARSAPRVLTVAP